MGTILGVRARVWRECSGMESPAQDAGTGSILDVSGKFVVGLRNAVVLGFTGSWVWGKPWRRHIPPRC